MKYLFTISALLLLASCSKKTEQSPANTVSINGVDYSTVVISNQTWTSVNYNGPGGINPNNSTTNNPTYGKLYDLAEAKAVQLPTGWRLPAIIDAEKLYSYLGAPGTPGLRINNQPSPNVVGDAKVSIKLKSTSGWTFTNGNNSSGFNAYPVGVYQIYPPYTGFKNFGLATLFWCSTDYMFSTGMIWYDTFEIINDNPTPFQYGDLATFGQGPDMASKYSLRFVKDNN